MAESNSDNQTLIEHLTELRKRIIYAAWSVALGFAACWSYSEILFDVIRRPIAPYLGTQTQGLIFTAPMDKFLAHIKVALLAGLITSAPLWLYQVWAFIAPGLYRREKKFGLIFIFSGTFLFLVGVSFVYWVVFPMAFKFLMGFGGATDTPMITISEYLSFFFTTTVVFGLAFELPLVLTILGLMGVIDHHFLIAKRRYAIVLLAALSAVLTPPDAMSMIFMLIPLLCLYEISVILVRFFGAKASTEEFASEP